MKTLSFWKKSLYSALIFFGTLIVLTAGYAAWNAAMSKVNPGNPLSANAWNALVDNIADLDSRWSRSGSDLVFTGGNVGIGTASPSAKLHVYGNTNGGIVSYIQNSNPGAGAYTQNTVSSDAGSVITQMNSAAAGGVGYLYSSATNGLNIYTTNASSLYLWTNNDSTRLTISPAGNVGIGTTGPVWDEVLSITKWNNNQVGLGIYTNNSAYTNSLVRVQTETAPSSSWKMYEGRSAGGGVRFYVDGFGNEYLAGTLTQSSDSRLKKEITPIESPLEKISSLSGVTYYWKDSTRDSKRQIGVIAQDIEKVFPEAVATDEKGMKSVAYGNLVAPLIEAVKELKKENDSLKARLDRLERE